MKSTKLALFSLFAVSVFAAGQASGSTLYGGATTVAAPFSTFFSIDQTTGARSAIAAGGFGYSDLTSDWRPQSYRIWGVSQDGQATLARIDPVTGVRTDIGHMTHNIQSLAFDPTTDTLFAAALSGLYKIDVNTGNATFIGTSAGLYPYEALGCDLAGNLFGFYSAIPSEGIARVDKTTGDFQLVGPTSTPDRVWLTDLAVRPGDGVMIGVSQAVLGSNKLYQVNTTTGALTPIGNTSLQQAMGLAFSPAPEPSTVLLVAAALPVLVTRGRKSAGRIRD